MRDRAAQDCRMQQIVAQEIVDVFPAAAQEAKDPKRDMPIGILGSLAICTGLYIAVGFVLTGIVSYDKLNVPDPIAVGIDAIGMGWLGPISSTRAPGRASSGGTAETSRVTRSIDTRPTTGMR